MFPKGRCHFQPDLAQEKYLFPSNNDPENTAAFARNVAAWEDKYGAKDSGSTGAAKDWAKAGFADSAWKTVTLPLTFGQVGMKAGGTALGTLRMMCRISPNAELTVHWT